jgi:hypothetical protein
LRTAANKKSKSNTYRNEGFYSLPSSITSFSIVNLLEGFFEIPVPVMHLKIRSEKDWTKNDVRKPLLKECLYEKIPTCAETQDRQQS